MGTFQVLPDRTPHHKAPLMLW